MFHTVGNNSQKTQAEEKVVKIGKMMGGINNVLPLKEKKILEKNVNPG